MTDNQKLKAPFPWFGGKSRVADVVWQRFGDVKNYVEPFFGSGAVLLGRPSDHAGYVETANDLDGFVANAWRSIANDPDKTAVYADNPVNENDLHARHAWLTERRESLSRKLEGNPDFYDAKIAGFWLWGMSVWIGGHFAGGKGPWQVVNGELVKMDTGQGVKRCLPRLSSAGQGVKRQRPHLSGAGQGVKRYMRSLRERLMRVRFCCGDWARVLGDSPTVNVGTTGVFLDPPYSAEYRADCYAVESFTVANEVGTWALKNQDKEGLRIALCGYEGEHDMNGWDCFEWKAKGGYGGQSMVGNDNAQRERIWFSPSCIRPSDETQLDMFEGML